MIVDDENSFREFAEIALRMEGHAIVTVGDGNEAIAILQKLPLDLCHFDRRILAFLQSTGYNHKFRLKTSPTI
ncbi:MAG: response regulator [Anaerolineae bacterium]|nr:response regulator [Anaerolineae bacterium]